MSSVSVRVPGKVNLQLSVGGLRPDGYHDLVNVLHAVSLYDELSARPGFGVSVTVSGTGPEGSEGSEGPAGSVPLDGDNLAVRAAYALAEVAGVPADVALHISKGIPVAGGMAGGSADAAAALLACDQLWGCGLGRVELDRLAARLGADVPFALSGGTAVGVGRGDRLTPALARGRFHWVLAVADGGLPTPAVYAECDRLRGSRRAGEPELSAALMSALRTGDAVGLGQALSNDLQPAALSLRPALRMTLGAGREHGALGALVSGSGPTCAFLARDEEHSIDLAVALSGAGVCRTVRRATGPVPGARLTTAKAA